MNRIMHSFTISTATLALTLSVGCSGQSSSESGKPASDSKTTAAAPTTQVSESELAAMRSLVGDKRGGGSSAGGMSNSAALPPGHPTIAPQQPAANSAGASGALPPGHPAIPGADDSATSASATDLKFEAPADWKSTPPRSGMRKAQYSVPGASGGEDAELVIYYFGAGQGGGLGDNLARWKGQFTAADGSPLPADAATQETFEASGMKVTLLEVAGRYAPGAMPGMANTGPHDNYRMLAAVIETPDGPWFVKATGPDATLAAQRDAVKKFLASAKR